MQKTNATSGVRVRRAQPEDGAACLEVYAPYVMHTHISFELTPPTAAELTQRLTAASELGPWLAAEVDDVLVGYAYASRFRVRPAYDWSVEVSVYVGSGAHRRGVGRALYQVLLAGLALQGYHSALAGIALPNDASVALHEALGFAPVGVFSQVGFKHGRWWDVGFWRVALGNSEAAPVKSPRWLWQQQEWLELLGGAR